MKKHLLYILLIITSLSTYAQTKNLTIKYLTSYNGETDTTSCTTVEATPQAAKIWYNGEEEYPDAPKKCTYIDYITKTCTNTATLSEGKTIATQTSFEYNKDWKFSAETDEILGYSCHKATTTINSNRIEIFYATDTLYKGTPVPNFGITNGLIFKVIVNGNRVIEAVDIATTESRNVLPNNYGTIISRNSYQKQLNDAAVKTVNVFHNNRICYAPDKKDEGKIEDGDVISFANGTVIVRQVTLPAGSWNYDIFAKLSQYSDGDAYDRTGSVFIIPQGKTLSYLDALEHGIEVLPYFTDNSGAKYHGLISTEDYDVPVEMMRFYTAFGTRKYNHIEYGDYNWFDSIIFEQDVTHLSTLLCDKVLIGMYIGNYDANGHIVNLDLQFHPKFEDITPNKITPLFCTLNIMEMGGQPYPVFFANDTLEVDFQLDDNCEEVVLSYISTGHGGWGGGDEFNKKPNTIIFDDNSTSFIPWRYDCASYRERNPCSGNFNNGLSSSDYSRSGWCPGTITNPTEFYYSEVKSGSHRIRICIPQGAKEGGSFSSWNVSGILIY